MKYGGDRLSKISFGYGEDAPHHILTVADNGVGMKKEDSEGIFDLFTRRDNTGNISGSGLGLAIVKEIAEKFGGSVWADFEYGQGAAFHISIRRNLQ